MAQNYTSKTSARLNTTILFQRELAIYDNNFILRMLYIDAYWQNILVDVLSLL